MTAAAPVCPRHNEPLQVVEEGVLNGTLTRYWGLCPGTPGRLVDSCVAHGSLAYAHRLRAVFTPPLPCRCVQPKTCDYETRTEDSDHSEPELFA